MKLFKSLLLAPVTLGLITPIASSANEINYADLSKYSSSREIKNIREFNPAKQIEVDKSNLKSFELIPDNFEAGFFSSTTTMSASTSFVIGAIDNDRVYDATTTGAVTSHYSYDIDLNTSFNGDDNLYIGIEAGNASTLFLDSSNIATDTLTVGSIFYSFPIGGWDVAVGPKLDQNDLVPTTTTKYSDSFYFGGSHPDNLYTLPGLTGTGISVSKVFENGINFGVNLTATEGSTDDGIFTKEGFDTKTVMVGYDGENFGGGLIHSKYDNIWGIGDQTAEYYLTYYGISNLALNSTSVGAYWLVNDKLTTNIGLEYIDANIGIDADIFTDITLSMDYEFNENNTFSAAYKSLHFLNTNGTADKVGDGFEFYYTHKMNDSMSSKIGLYYASPTTNDGDGTAIVNGGTGDDWVLYDQTVYAFETTFKF